MGWRWIIGQGARQYGQGAAPSEICLAGTLSFKTCASRRCYLTEAAERDEREDRSGRREDGEMLADARPVEAVVHQERHQTEGSRGLQRAHDETAVAAVSTSVRINQLKFCIGNNYTVLYKSTVVSESSGVVRGGHGPPKLLVNFPINLCCYVLLGCRVKNVILACLKNQY